VPVVLVAPRRRRAGGYDNPRWHQNGPVDRHPDNMEPLVLAAALVHPSARRAAQYTTFALLPSRRNFIMNFHQVSVLKVGNRIPPQVSGCSAVRMHGSALAQKPDDNRR